MVEQLIIGETYLVKKGGWECYCTFKQVIEQGFVFDNSGVEIIIESSELKDCVTK